MRGRRNVSGCWGRFSVAPVLALSVGALALPPAATAATTVGETFSPTASSGDVTHLQSADSVVSYTIPSNGVLTSWSVQGHASFTFQIKLKVGRPVGAGTFTIVGESTQQTAAIAVLNTHATRIPVQAGDKLGLYSTSFFGRALGAGSGAVRHFIPGDQAVGTTAFFPFQSADQTLDVSAQLEGDADNDGFGDESQDDCLGSTGPDNGCPIPDSPAPPDVPSGADTSPPDTQITDGPSSKARSKSAKFAFTWTDTRGMSRFECKLDSGPFESCISPKTYSGLKSGPHTFEVRAVDAAGNVDPSPATRTWTVKKKKKR